MKRLTFLLFFLMVSFYGCSKRPIIKLPITTTSQKALNYYERGMRSFQVGDWIEMNADLDSALELDPEFAMALEMYESENPKQNIEMQEKAKSLINKISEAEIKMLDIRESYRKGDMNKALENAKWLVDNHGSSYESYVWLGQVQSDRYELEEATNSLNKAIKLNPDCFDAYNLLMGHHIGAGNQVMLPPEKRNVELGMEYGDELIRIRGDHGYPYHFKANVYRQQGAFDKAKPLYEKSIEKRKGKSSESTALLVSGHNFMFSGDLEKARERYRQAVALEKESRWWFVLSFYVTVSHIFDNDYYGALDNINRVEKEMKNKEFDKISLISNKAEISFQKMICYAHNQMEEEAYGALESFVGLQREGAALLNDENNWRAVNISKESNKAWVNILFGKYEEAKKNLSEIKRIQEKINDPTSMYQYHGLLGMAQLMEGNYQSAVENFKKGDPTNIYFNYFKALSLKASGEKGDAQTIFREIANTNFANWELAIVRKLAQKQLEAV